MDRVSKDLCFEGEGAREVEKTCDSESTQISK